MNNLGNDVIVAIDRVLRGFEARGADVTAREEYNVNTWVVNAGDHTVVVIMVPTA